MASGIFQGFAHNLLGNGTRVEVDTDTLAIALIDSADVTISRTTHDFYDDIAAGEVATGDVGSVTITGGTLDFADETLAAVTGDTAEQVVLYKNTGVDSTSVLMLLWDAGGFTSGMPVTPNGGDITFSPSASGAAAWYA